MDIKSLMIGDWVYDTLSQTNIKVNRGCFEINPLNGIGYEENLIPIPLTPEILKKNGMHLYNRKTNRLMERCNHSDCFKEDENFTVELSLDNDGKIRWTINGDEYTIMPLDYVHQLQQALRLCGINKEITL